MSIEGQAIQYNGQKNKDKKANNGQINTTQKIKVGAT
jgi:hypothetical protein